MKCSAATRLGFSLVELVVVVMILGILGAIAAPRLLDTSGQATDNGVRHTLSVIRDAIDRYSADHAGELPGADGLEPTFKSDLAPYLRGPAFPMLPVGASQFNDVLMVGGTDPGLTNIEASEGIYSWAYKYETGEFYANSTALSADGETPYCDF